MVKQKVIYLPKLIHRTSMAKPYIYLFFFLITLSPTAQIKSEKSCFIGNSDVGSKILQQYPAYTTIPVFVVMYIGHSSLVDSRMHQNKVHNIKTITNL